MSTNVGINVAVTSTGTQQVTVQIQGMGAAAAQASNAVDTLNRALTGLGIGAVLNQLRQYADAWSNVEGMIRTATKTSADAVAVQQKLFQVAQDTRQPLTDVASLYQRVAIQAEALGLSQNQVIQITRTLGEALVIQHTSAQQASGALLQFGQALSTGKVRAQEWNSVMTGLPVLAKAIGEQLGTTAAGVKALLTSGKVTSQGLADAVLAAGATLTTQFNESAHTIAQSFTVLKNAATQWIGTTLESINASNTFGSSMQWLATNFDAVAKSVIALTAAWAAWALLTGGLATVIDGVTAAVLALNAAVLANPIVALVAVVAGAAVALYEFRNSIVVNTDAALTLGDYLTSLWGIIKDGAAAAWQAIQSFGGAVTSILGPIWDDIVANAKAAFNTLIGLLPTVINFLIGYFVGFYNSVTTIWNNFPEYFASLFIQAFNGALQLANGFTNSLISIVNAIGDKVDFHIDPIQFAGIENTFKGVTDTVAENFKTAFNTDYVGQFVNKLTQGAEAAKALRTATAGVANLDAHGTPAPFVDPNAAKKLEQLQNQLRTLLNTIDPSAGAILDLAKGTKTLTAALAAHLITGAQFNTYMAALRLHYEDIIDPQKAYLKNLNQETSFLQLDGDARTVLQDSYKQEQDLRKKSIILSSSEIVQMQQTIQLNLTANEIAQQRQKIIATTVQPQKDYTQSLAAANQLYAQGTITAAQYNDALETINITYLDSQKTLSSGIQSGLLTVMQNFSNVGATVKNAITSAFDSANTALANFVTTGTLNFKSLTDSILQDMIKIELQILESKALTSLFGSSGAGVSAIGSLFGAGAGYASGGYTGDGPANQVAGYVHKGEVVVNANVVSQPGMRAYLEALNSGTANAAPGGSVAAASGGTGSSAAAVGIQVVINNNASDKVSATASQGTDQQGNPNMTIAIDMLESQLAGRVSSGRGKLFKAVGNAYGLQSRPSRG